MFSKTISKLLKDTRELAAHVDQADEYIAVKEIEKAIEEFTASMQVVREKLKNIELAIYEAQKVFERTKNDNEESSAL